MSDSLTKPSKRGYAGMDPERRRAIAAKGGAAVPKEKQAYSKDPELASRAGRKGGQTRAAQASFKTMGHSGGIASSTARAAQEAGSVATGLDQA